MLDTCGRTSDLPSCRQKGLEIGLGNPHQSVDPVCDKQLVFDPSANAAFGGGNALGNLLNRVEFHRRLWLIGFHWLLTKL